MLSFIKLLRRYFRRIFYGFDVNFLNEIRSYELKKIESYFPKSKQIKVLEVGGGTGKQAMLLREKGYDIHSIDLETSNYSQFKHDIVSIYDGVTIPFDADTFDVVFSSNVLEHIADLPNIMSELKRVTKQDGIGIHLMPSPSWRFYTSIADLIYLWHFKKKHGEHASNIFTEFFVFRKAWWIKQFHNNAFSIILTSTNGLFYSGASLMGPRISLSSRCFLSKFLGASCNVFVVKST